MKSLKDSLKLYAITDRMWLEENETMHEKVEQAIAGGITMLQLREKHMEYEAFVNEALQMKQICQKEEIMLIINDSIEVAYESKADGVHLGQSDKSVAEARKRLGEEKIIGVSVHNKQEALLAQEMGADYLGVGAVFTTETKKDATSVSYDTLKEICESVRIPVVAIGGISLHNINKLKGTNLSGIAVIHAIFGQKEIEKAARDLRNEVEKIL